MSKEEQVIKNYRDLFNKMVWLNEIKMKENLKGYSPSEVHCIEYIGKNANPNVTKLADSFYMTRGAITKMTRKLMEKGVIESFQKPDNKKEVCFRLTSKGKSVHETHEKLHAEFRERDNAVFERITDEQFDVMLDFAERYNRHLDDEIKKIHAD